MSQLSNLSTPLKPSIELIDHPLQLTSSAWPLPLSMSIQLNNSLFHFPSSLDPNSPSAPTTVVFLYSFLHQNTWQSSQFSLSPIPSPLILPPTHSIQDLSQVTTETSSTLLSPAVDSQSYPLGDQVPLGPEEVEPSPRSQQVLGLPDLPTHVSVHPARAVWFHWQQVLPVNYFRSYTAGSVFLTAHRPACMETVIGVLTCHSPSRKTCSATWWLQLQALPGSPASSEAPAAAQVIEPTLS